MRIEGIPMVNRFLMVVCAFTLSGCSIFLSSRIDDESEKEFVEWRTNTGDLRQAIVTGAKQKGWMVLDESPDCVSLRLFVRRHVVDVDVFYGQTEFIVKYKNSENMGYDPRTGKLHRSYKAWVRDLKQSIKYAAKLM